MRPLPPARTSRAKRLGAAILALLSVATRPASVHAQALADGGAAQGALAWPDSWSRFRPAEYAWTALAAPAAMAMYVWLPPQRTPHWVGGILFDDDVRGLLRVRSPSALAAVRVAADVVGVVSVVLVVGVDSLIVPFARGRTDVGVQLGLLDAEAFASSSVLTFALYDSVGRARPLYADCLNGSADPQCRVSPTASFPSGHTSEAFTAAGLSCAHHLYLPLYGSRTADVLACARDIVLASADGVLRVMGDRHYATDVLVGGAIGFAFGYGVPTLLHYRFGLRSPLRELSLRPAPGAALGLAATGSF